MGYHAPYEPGAQHSNIPVWTPSWAKARRIGEEIPSDDRPARSYGQPVTSRGVARRPGMGAPFGQGARLVEGDRLE